jgi:tRNA pseudouridine55 synthase
VGEATKFISFLKWDLKVYQFCVTWGEQRTTDDSEGEISAVSDVRPSPDLIEKTIPSFIGCQHQKPPSFSALHYKGKRSYEWARKGIEIELPNRPIEITSLKILNIENDRAFFEVTSRKGMYVRSLARDLAHSMGTVGYVSYLRRTTDGIFQEKDTFSMEKIQEMAHKGSRDFLQPIDAVLDDIPVALVTEEESILLRRGMKILSPGQEGIFLVKREKEIVGLASRFEGYLHPKRVLTTLK